MNLLLENGIYGTFLPGDHRRVSLDEAVRYRNWWVDKHLDYVKMEHPEYQSLNQFDRDELLNKCAGLFALIRTMSPQQFFNVLMIVEVIWKLLQKLFNKSSALDNEEFAGITIIIHRQDTLVVQLMKRGLFYPLLFIMSREKPIFRITIGFFMLRFFSFLYGLNLYWVQNIF